MNNKFDIRFIGSSGECEVVAGKTRLGVLMDMGERLEGFDAKTGKHYSLEVRNGQLFAKEVESQ